MVEADGEFRRLAGRAIGVLFLVSGLISTPYAFSMPSATARAMMLAESLVAAAAGLVMMRLPWHRWSRATLLFPVPPALALIGLANWADPDPYLAAIMFFLLAMWLGIAQPRGTALALSPLLAAAYWVPLAAVPHAPGLGRSVFYVVAVCVLAGESLAWLTAGLRAAQARLRDHDERRFQAMIASSSDTTVVLSPAGEATYLSPSAARVLHRPVDELRGRTLTVGLGDQIHPDEVNDFAATLDRLLRGASVEETVRFRARRADGTWCDVEGVGRNLLADHAVRGVLLNLRDVSERTELERALTQQAFTDLLTGLPNRTLLRDRTEQALRLAGRAGHSVALLLIDLDRFKEVNDTLGHRHGDMLLQRVAERLRVVVRDTDTIARLGGDEFGVLLPRVVTIDDAVAVVAKLRAAVEEPFVVDGLTLDLDASIGVAVWPEHAVDFDELLQKADVAMYAAKATHLDHVTYEPGLDRCSPRRLGLLGQLRRAIANGELVVFHQPKADAHGRQIKGTEALVRWQHPDHGLLGPDEFIPLAETTGLMRPLTSHVLDVALRDCRGWLDSGHDLSVSVNVSVRCLLDLALPADVAGRLEAWAIEPGRLVLEITESAIMTDPHRALKVLNDLYGLGVRLSIDDFGTGYSSMAYLRNLPVHELKVDRSFVKHMRDKASDRLIVRSVVDLGHNLGLQVVAEGVEDDDTWRDLEALGCDQVQGYVLSRPVPATDLTGWLASRPDRTRLA